MSAQSIREEAEGLMLECCRETGQPIIARSTELEVVRVLAWYIERQRASSEADTLIKALEDVMNNPIARTALDDELYNRILNLTAACGRVPTGCVRCGEPVREILDGDPLCQAHCDEWARAEGR